MKQRKLALSALLSTCLVALAVILLPGCEEDGDTDVSEIGEFSTDESQFSPTGIPLKQDFGLTPQNPSIESTHFEDEGVPSGVAGATEQFTAFGGTEPYSEWESSASGIGTVNQVGLFTYAGGIGETVISVRDAQGRISQTTATAMWKAGTLPDLEISPSTVSLLTERVGTNDPPVYSSANLTGVSMTFVVAGGLPPYTWAIGSSGLGNFEGVDESATLILATNPPVGSVTITARDSIDQLVAATVTIANPD